MGFTGVTNKGIKKAMERQARERESILRNIFLKTIKDIPAHELIPKFYKKKLKGMDLSSKYQIKFLNEIITENFQEQLGQSLVTHEFKTSHKLVSLDERLEIKNSHSMGTHIPKKNLGLTVTLEWQVQKELKGWENLELAIKTDNTYRFDKQETFQQVIHNPLGTYKSGLNFSSPVFNELALDVEARKIMVQHFGKYDSLLKIIPEEISGKKEYAISHGTAPASFESLSGLSQFVDGILLEFEEMTTNPLLEQRIEDFRRKNFEKELQELKTKYDY
ncbi:MAG: hypothetical protein GOU97_01485 [Nanoarchaeota archaeon]|nr:hypothetical protein [Nanoarchaeota archaeon]